MKLDTIVISDFLDNPDLVRQSLIENEVEFPITGNFPGRRTALADDGYQEMFLNKLREVLPFDIDVNYDSSSFSFQLCLDGEETWAHLDEYQWTGVLYLTPDPNPDSGTLVLNPDNSMVTTLIANVYNRLVLFRGGTYPHRSNVAGFGDCLENGRLTQVIFFNEVE